MTLKKILDIRSRGEFRDWLIKNGETEKECWIAVKRSKTPPDDALWYHKEFIGEEFSMSRKIFKFAVY